MTRGGKETKGKASTCICKVEWGPGIEFPKKKKKKKLSEGGRAKSIKYSYGFRRWISVQP